MTLKVVIKYSINLLIYKRKLFVDGKDKAKDFKNSL